MSLSELAERCEQATGPDREIDALIAPLTGLHVVNEGHPLGRCCYDKRGHGVPLPAFTASLDAAMTLLDESWFFHVSRFSPCESGGGQAHVYPNRGLGDDYEADAATSALALCAAALRARAASGMEARQGGNEVPCEAQQPGGEAETPKA